MYVLRYDQDRAQMVGPFNDSGEAARWAEAVSVNDDPRWAVVCNPEVTVVEPLAITRVTEVVILTHITQTVVKEYVPEVCRIYDDMINFGVDPQSVISLINDHGKALLQIAATSTDYNKVSELTAALDDLIAYRKSIIAQGN